MVIFFVCGGLEINKAVTTSRIASIYLLNTTDSCFMAAMVEYPSFKNGALGSVFCKACASCFDAPMALSYDDGKGTVK